MGGAGGPERPDRGGCQGIKKGGPQAPEKPCSNRKSLTYFFFLVAFFAFFAAFFFVAITSPPSRQPIDSSRARC